MNILEDIVSKKRIEVQHQKEAITIDQLLSNERLQRKGISMRDALLSSPSGIIAEFKRRSPSKGWIKEGGIAPKITLGYEQSGASATSILTDRPFFGGGIEDLCQARPQLHIPILRKEFIIDEYQIYQSKVIGADAILLIASILDLESCKRFTQLAHELGLEVLLELHGEEELDHIACEADMVGINNRNLTTFVTDASHSIQMIERLPAGGTYISESGLSDTATVRQLRNAGFKGFLMGENFMKTPDPALSLAQFIDHLNDEVE